MSQSFPRRSDPDARRLGAGSGRAVRPAGVSHDDIDLVQTYDDYPVMSVIQLEDLGFCAKGEGPQFIRSHSFTPEGSFPLNTSGGQLSVGTGGAAAGFLGLTEALRQVTARRVGSACRGCTNWRWSVASE